MTSIEWTDETWNPVTGCDKVSAGCKNCYAERMAKRLQAMGNPRYGNGFGVTLHADKLEEPLRWSKPRRVFVNSMSDLFHEDVPDEFIDKVWKTMANATEHTFQVLTKRPKRMLHWSAPRLGWELPNVWLGTSVEDQATADERIPHLLETPAAVRFLSCEPLLGPIQLGVSGEFFDHGVGGGPKIGWVIVGGESGPGARPMDPAWVRSVRDQCVAAGVPFFFKQWGGTNKKAAGCVLDGRTWDEMP